jgi:lysyl-tRNA synthetase class 2
MTEEPKNPKATKGGGTAPPEAPVDENKLIAERRAKLAEARAAGQAFPNDFRRDALAGELHAAYG